MENPGLKRDGINKKELHDQQVCTIITVRIRLSVHYQLVKMLITLEPHSMF